MSRICRLIIGAVLLVPWAAGYAQITPTGVSVGVGAWSQSPSGDMTRDGNTADIEDDLQIGSERDVFVWADLRHPIPVLPRLKLRHTPLALSGSGSVEDAFSFGDTTFTVGEEVASEVELDQTDIILYWTPWSLGVDLDLGVNVKVIDGLVEVERGNGDRERASFTGPVPMAYARTQAFLPGTGVFGGAEGSLVAYSGNRLVDVTLRAGYRGGYGLGAFAIEGGWKFHNLRLDDFDGIDADVTVDGPYLGVSASF